ncbi:MAG: UDP-N-acetylmuramate dehydrogenase [Deltaproteobacteria bacterium]|nr:UDP-N-acetylmuramate dehydrogenase [Deltaproteobacteria bacterium]
MKTGLSKEAGKWLAARFGPDARFSEPMAAYTALGVGGPADALVTVADDKALADLLAGCKKRGLPLHFLGGGTNLLVADAGVRGVVARLGQGFSRLVICKTPSGTLLSAGAAAPLARAVSRAVARGFSGMLFAAGIPGTVGGAVAGNAGTAEGGVQDALRDFSAVTWDGKRRRLSARRVQWAYRSLCPAPGDPGWAVITRARFALSPGDPAALAKKLDQTLAGRKKVQPAGVRSAGSFFKNPENGRPAGMLIDRAGCKGLCLGGAAVSDVHANFLVNKGRATAADFLGLADMVKEKVFAAFGIELVPEVRILGA